MMDSFWKVEYIIRNATSLFTSVNIIHLALTISFIYWPIMFEMISKQRCPTISTKCNVSLYKFAKINRNWNPKHTTAIRKVYASETTGATYNLICDYLTIQSRVRIPVA